MVSSLRLLTAAPTTQPWASAVPGLSDAWRRLCGETTRTCTRRGCNSSGLGKRYKGSTSSCEQLMRRFPQHVCGLVNNYSNDSTSLY